MVLVLLYLDRDGPLADTACWRHCHASIKSRQTSPTGDERQNTRKSGPGPADSLKASQLAAGRDHPFGVGRHRRANPISKPPSSSGAAPYEARRFNSCASRSPIAKRVPIAQTSRSVLRKHHRRDMRPLDTPIELLAAAVIGVKDSQRVGTPKHTDIEYLAVARHEI